MILKYITLERLQLVNEMITQLDVYKLIAIDLSKQQKQMLIQKQYNKLILLEI